VALNLSMRVLQKKVDETQTFEKERNGKGAGCGTDGISLFAIARSEETRVMETNFWRQGGSKEGSVENLEKRSQDIGRGTSRKKGMGAENQVIIEFSQHKTICNCR